jgi:sRNA-binding regulator protein Hfq
MTKEKKLELLNSFLENKKPVILFLRTGIKLSGIIKDYNNHSIIIENQKGKFFIRCRDVTAFGSNPSFKGDENVFRR